MAEITIRVSDKAVKLALALFAIALLLWGLSQFGSWDVFRPKYQLQMFVADRSGLQVGAPVTVDGFPVGSVSGLNLAQNSERPDRRIRVALKIQMRFQDMIRDDSATSIATQGLLGQPYIEIQRGYSGSPIKSGGVIRIAPARQFSITDLKKAAGCQNEGKNMPAPTGPPDSRK